MIFRIAAFSSLGSVEGALFIVTAVAGACVQCESRQAGVREPASSEPAGSIRSQGEAGCVRLGGWWGSVG